MSITKKSITKQNIEEFINTLDSTNKKLTPDELYKLLKIKYSFTTIPVELHNNRVNKQNAHNKFQPSKYVNKQIIYNKFQPGKYVYQLCYDRCINATSIYVNWCRTFCNGDVIAVSTATIPADIVITSDNIDKYLLQGSNDTCEGDLAGITKNTDNNTDVYLPELLVRQIIGSTGKRTPKSIYCIITKNFCNKIQEILKLMYSKNIIKSNYNESINHLNTSPSSITGRYINGAYVYQIINKLFINL
jgi:hypothetical protein